MPYPVTCACGKTHHVAGSAAGTTFTCGCRRAVEIPSFAKLKAAVGQSSFSADFALEQLIQTGRLPLEADCVVCSRPTKNRVVARVACERERTPAREFHWYDVLRPTSGTSGRPSPISTATRDARTVGVDRIYPVPVRVCGECAMDLTGPAAIRDALLKTPIYADLLRKYPDSQLSLHPS